MSDDVVLVIFLAAVGCLWLALMAAIADWLKETK